VVDSFLGRQGRIAVPTTSLPFFEMIKRFKISIDKKLNYCCIDIALILDLERRKR